MIIVNSPNLSVAGLLDKNWGKTGVSEIMIIKIII